MQIVKVNLNSDTEHKKKTEKKKTSATRLMTRGVCVCASV